MTTRYHIPLFSVLFLVIQCYTTVIGQYRHRDIFPGIQGKALQDSLVKQYKSYALLTYADCRDTLFAKIDVRQDSLECIYTGMKRYLPPGEDPTQAVLLNGAPNGINTEHAYPQAKGASGYGRSDMHHLYATRIKANTDRGNKPFREIPDNLTKTWYYLTNEMSAIPTNGRQLYSESNDTHFEPREASKGDIARSVFYFYTMYRADADAADAQFFTGMLNDLCEWHNLDPVDQKEWERTHGIEKYQGNVNPFVIDCSLVSRAYCQNLSQECEYILDTEQQSALPKSFFEAYPNPSESEMVIAIDAREQDYVFEIADLSGRRVIGPLKIRNSEFHQMTISLKSGIYFARLSPMHHGGSFMVRKLIFY
jgi:hypothetical protein